MQKLSFQQVICKTAVNQLADVVFGDKQDRVILKSMIGNIH